MRLKRFFALFCSMLMITGQLSVKATEGEIPSKYDGIVEFKFLNEPSHIMDVNNASFEVILKNREKEQQRFTISYVLDGETFSEVVRVQPMNKSVKSIRFKNPPKGVFDLEVNVFLGSIFGDILVKREVKRIGIISYYTPQFMDEYARYGMCMHFFRGGGRESDEIDTDLLTKAGFGHVRDEMRWATVEKSKNVFSYQLTDWYYDIITKSGLDLTLILTYTNPLYALMENSVDGYIPAPTTKAEVEGFVNYTRQVLTRYPEIKTVEIWNEPNHKTFWPLEANAYDYAQLVKSVSLAVREINPEIQIMIASIAPIDGDIQFLDELLSQNVFAYVDAVSTHPYVYPGNPDTRLLNKINQYENVINKWGGWKDHYVTEVGWPTNTDAKGVSEEEQAVNAVKYAVYSEQTNILKSTWYNFKSKGIRPEYTEDNFGIVKRDYLAKPAYAAFSQANNRLNGAIYTGELNLGDNIKGSLFIKDGKPMLTAWTIKDTAVIDMPNQAVEDMYGNLVDCGNSIPLDTKPKYVFGITNSYFAKAANINISKGYENWLNDWGGDYQKSDEIDALSSYSKTLVEIPSLDDVRLALNRHYAVGEDLISQYEAGGLEISEEALMHMLFELHKIGKMWGNLLSQSVMTQKISAVEIKSDETMPEVNELIASKTMSANHTAMKISQEILRHANRYNEQAHTVSKMASNAGKEGVVVMYDALAEKLAGWVMKVASFEKPDENMAVLIYTEKSKIKVYQDETTTYNITIDNKKGLPLEAVTLCILDEEEEVIWESKEFDVNDGESRDVKISVVIPQDKIPGTYQYNAVLKKDNESIQRKSIKTEVLGRIDLSILPSSQGLSSIKKVTVKLENILEYPIDINVKMDAPKGWLLKQNVQQVKMDAKQVKEIDFEISAVSKIPFNHYVFNVSVEQKDKILIEKKLPLSFLTFVRSDEELSVGTFDGDISSWSDAYPIHINSPEDPEDKQEWQFSNLAGRIFGKWDDNYIYVMADVYDNEYAQINKGVSIWDGDSIQLSFDTLNDKATSYKGDDYELTFALTMTGEEVYAHKAGENPHGAKSGEWLKMIRDEEQKISRYLIKIPKSELSPMSNTLGYRFGFNVALNDSDLYSREAYAEFSEGTAGSKNPSKYYTFTLSPKEMGVPADRSTDFTVSLNSTLVHENTSMFIDLDGHWAQDDIEKLARAGIINGMGNGKFEPEKAVTRAEFVRMAVNIAEFELIPYNNSYPDVKAEDWYAEHVQTAYSKGIIPQAMTENGFKAELPISREEMAVIAVGILYGVPDESNIKAAAEKFEDFDDVAPWARPYTSKAYFEKLMSGISESIFSPAKPSTRAQAAVIIRRMLNN